MSRNGSMAAVYCNHEYQDRLPRDEFERLVRKYSRLMAAAIRRVCGQRHLDLIPDVEQEVYLALWKRLQTGKKIEYPASYLYKMALTTALALTRKAARSEFPVDENRDSSSERTASASFLDGLEPVERAQLVEEILGQLNPDAGRCAGCYVTEEEEAVAEEALGAFRVHEGLLDDNMPKSFKM